MRRDPSVVKVEGGYAPAYRIYRRGTRGREKPTPIKGAPVMGSRYLASEFSKEWTGNKGASK